MERIDRSEHGVAIHHDLRGRHRDQRAAAHRIVRNKHGDLAFVVHQRLGDLLGGYTIKYTIRGKSFCAVAYRQAQRWTPLLGQIFRFSR